ncbi:MAG: hypothetical protein GY814_19235, partial [Gammaproteobacteria bacterium]|nr:hypothetical protein [Gammaproteobacteria bacterium]
MKKVLIFIFLLVLLFGAPVYAYDDALNLNHFTEKIRQHEASVRIYWEKVARTTSGDTELGESLRSLAEKAANDPPMAENKIYDLYLQVLIIRFARGQVKTPVEMIALRNNIWDLAKNGVPTEILIMDRTEWIISKMYSSFLNLGIGIVTDMVPFTSTLSFITAFRIGFVDEWTTGGDELSYKDMLRGQITRELGDRMDKMDNMAKLDAADSFLDAVNENNRLLTGQDFQKLLVINESFGRQNKKQERWKITAITIA